MPQTIFFLTLICVAGPVPESSKKAAGAIRTAYEDNRAALSANGTIRFHSHDGHLGPSATVEGIDAALKASWERHSPSDGVYAFDGVYRRYDNLYSTEVLVARRKKLSATAYSSVISSYRLLADGETVLIDTFDVDSDDKTILRGPHLRAGVEHFFRLAEGIPLRLGDSQPPYELGARLAKALAGSEEAVLAEVDETARLDSLPMVKLKIDFPASRKQITFWVDLEHGAIPVQTRYTEFVPHAGATVVLQINNNDIKWVGRGWLPFRWSAAVGEISSTGAVPSMFIREVVIDKADFTNPPDRAMFALEFPKEYGLTDDRMLSYGVRQVWDVKDFSADARARAESIRGSASPATMPEMPAARLPWSWLSLSLIFLGITLLFGSGTVVFRRVRRHA